MGVHDSSHELVANWQSSIAVRITGSVLYVLVMVGFVVAVITLQRIDDQIEEEYDTAATRIAYETSLHAVDSCYRDKEEMARHLTSIVCCQGFSSAIVPLPTGEVNLGERGKEDVELLRTITVVSEGGVAAVTMRLYHPPIKGRVEELRRRIFVITGIATLIFGFFLTWVILRFITKPVQRLIDATCQVTEGDLELQLPEDREDEFGLLSRNFNRMTATIRQELADRRQAELALRRTNEFIKTSLDSLNDSISIIDSDFRILGVNATFLKEHGCSEAEVLGRTCYDVTHQRCTPCTPPDDICPLLETLQSGEHAVAEHIHYERDGRRLFAEVSTSPIRDEEGKIVQFVHVSRDITERKKGEERLRGYAEELRESNDELRNFTYIFSHDLRAPLVNIKGFATELLSSLTWLEVALNGVEERLTEEERQEIRVVLGRDIPESLQFIDSSVGRMDSLINSILTLSRLGHRQLRFVAVDTGELIRKALANLTAEIEIHQARVTVDTLPVVQGDLSSLEIIFGHLLDNAVKYLQPGRPGVITVSCRQDEHEFVFAISDNGRGITLEDQEKIFDILRRAGNNSVAGQGMGLAYVRTLLRRHGGRIVCDSEPGVGTTFTFTLPVRPVVIGSGGENGDAS